MVTARDHVLQLALNMGDAPVQQRRPEDPGPPGQPGELIRRRPREPPRDVLLIAGQHVDREMLAAREPVQRRRALAHAEQHQRRLQRHGGERVRGQPVPHAGLIAGGHDGHAGREGPDCLPEIPAVKARRSQSRRSGHACSFSKAF